MPAENKKNVLVVTSSFPRWEGDFAGLFVLDLSEKLSQSFNMVVLAPYCPGTKTKENVRGLSVYRFKYFWPDKCHLTCGPPGIMPNLKNNKLLFFTLPFLFISQFIGIARLIRKEKIDLIHAHWFWPSGLVSVLAAKIFRKPVIVTSHGPDIMGLRGIFFDKIRQWVINKADLFTAISPVFTKQLISESHINNPEKVSSISMGVDVNLFKNLDVQEGKEKVAKKLGFYPSKPILLFIGALAEHKGIRYLIESLPEVVNKFPGTNLLIIGKGSDEAKFKNLSASLNLSSKVHFLGSIPNQELPHYYNQADVFVFPSLREGLPVVLMEALSTGCPIVTTPIAGIPDMIQDGSNGLLVKTKSSSEVSRAVIRILTDEGLRKTVAYKARQTAEERYDWKIITDKFKKNYEKLL